MQEAGRPVVELHEENLDLSQLGEEAAKEVRRWELSRFLTAIAAAMVAIVEVFDH